MPTEEVQMDAEETVEPTPEVNAEDGEPENNSDSSVAVEAEAVSETVDEPEVQAEDEAPVEVQTEESAEEVTEESEVAAVDEPVEPTPASEPEVAEDPVAEDPVAEDQVAEAPVAEDPVAEAPVVKKAPAKPKVPPVPTYQEAFPPLGGNAVNGGTSSIKKANVWSTNQIRKIKPTFTTQVFILEHLDQSFILL